MNTKTLALGALLLAVTLSSSAQEIVDLALLPSATLQELSLYPSVQREPRVIRQRPFPFPSRFDALAGAAAPIQVAPTIPAPPVRTSFFSATSEELGPADASGAVGPRHVMGVYNSGVVIHDRSGAILSELRLEQFWAEPSRRPASFYDPRVVYDARSDRWVVVSLDDETYLMIAASKTGDPTGEWNRYRLKPSGIERDIDYTRLALTRETVLVGSIIFDAGSTVMFSIDKTAIYDVKPDGAARQYVLAGLATAVHGPETPIEYVVRSNHQVRRLDETDWLDIEQPFDWMPAEISAPQKGSSMLLDFGAPDIEHAVYRAGSIHMVQTVEIDHRAALLWWIFDPETGEVHDAASIEHPTDYYAFSSVAVNRAGAMVIGFAVTSKNVYASAAYVYRDVNGAMSPVTLLTAGDSPVTISERWGDYTTTVVDPFNENNFWTVQIHAQNEAWATRWSHITPPSPTLRRRSARH